MSPLSGLDPDAANQQLLVSDDEDNELPNSAAAGQALALLCSDGLCSSEWSALSHADTVALARAGHKCLCSGLSQTCKAECNGPDPIRCHVWHAGWEVELLLQAVTCDPITYHVFENCSFEWCERR